MKEGLHFLCEKQKIIISHLCVNLCIYSHSSLNATGDPGLTHMYLYLSLLFNSRIQGESCITTHYTEQLRFLECTVHVNVC